MPILFENKTAKKIEVSSSMTPFTAYAMHPKGIKFETQDAEEEVILFLRQHIILLIPWLILGGLLLIVPTVLFPLLARFLALPVGIPWNYVLIGIIFWYLATFGFMLTKFIQWYFNIFIVTDQRIVDIDFIQLLYKEFSEAQLSRVQDISYQTKGIVGTLFNYGDVLIQTAGEVPNFVFESVPRPNEVVNVISELAKKSKQEL